MALKATLLALVASMSITMANAEITVQDTGTASSCGAQGSACCIPSCTVNIYGEGPCAQETVAWSSTCGERKSLAEGEQDVGGCPGYTQTWSKDANGIVVITIAGDDGYDNPIGVTDCGAPSTGGGQCVPSDGGCGTDDNYVRPT